MKTFIYIILFIIIASLIYNLAAFDYSLGIMSENNRPFIIGLGAGVCGFILCLIMLKSHQLKPNLENQSEKE